MNKIGFWIYLMSLLFTFQNGCCSKILIFKYHKNKEHLLITCNVAGTFLISLNIISLNSHSNTAKSYYDLHLRDEWTVHSRALGDDIPSASLGFYLLSKGATCITNRLAKLKIIMFLRCKRKVCLLSNIIKECFHLEGLLPAVKVLGPYTQGSLL